MWCRKLISSSASSHLDSKTASFVTARLKPEPENETDETIPHQTVQSLSTANWPIGSLEARRVVTRPPGTRSLRHIWHHSDCRSRLELWAASNIHDPNALLENRSPDILCVGVNPCAHGATTSTRYASGFSPWANTCPATCRTGAAIAGMGLGDCLGHLASSGSYDPSMVDRLRDDLTLRVEFYRDCPAGCASPRPIGSWDALRRFHFPLEPHNGPGDA